MPKSNLGRGPDIGGGVLLEKFAVAGKSPFVPIFKLVVFGSTTLSRIVVQGAGEHFAIHPRPIRLGVAHVQVPCLVHCLAWSTSVAAYHAEKNEALVLFDDLV